MQPKKTRRADLLEGPSRRCQCSSSACAAFQVQGKISRRDFLDDFGFFVAEKKRSGSKQDSQEGRSQEGRSQEGSPKRKIPKSAQGETSGSPLAVFFKQIPSCIPGCSPSCSSSCKSKLQVQVQVAFQVAGKRHFDSWEQFQRAPFSPANCHFKVQAGRGKTSRREELNPAGLPRIDL